MKSHVEVILGRREAPIPSHEAYTALDGKRILITGAAGSLGCALIDDLGRAQIDSVVYATDLLSKGDNKLNVASRDAVSKTFHRFKPHVIYHLAGAKHAPRGEVDPWSTCEINVTGTYNVLKVANLYGCRVVVASTCKAADPETVYGSSKLIAERMTLNMRQRVARFYNVPETAGNVFRLWEELAETGKMLPVMPCRRYFISSAEAVSLLLAATVTKTPGRYTFNPGEARSMRVVAEALYPGHPLQHLPPRRGDRKDEKLYANCETFSEVHKRLYRISSPHDPMR